LCAGAIFACAEPQPDVSSGLLARVGDAEFYIDDLLAFERRVEAGDSLSVADHAEYLATLVDRELLVAEALSLNLQDDARLTEVLEQDSEGKLSDMMFDRQVAERATPTPEEGFCHRRLGPVGRQHRIVPARSRRRVARAAGDYRRP
jgi:hypothetical protein